MRGWFLVLMVAACAAPVIDADVQLPVGPVITVDASVALDRLPEHVVLRLPEAAPPVPEVWEIETPWTLAEQASGADVYETPLPFDPALVPTESDGARTIGAFAPEGLVVSSDLGVLRFGRRARAQPGWGFDRSTLWVGVKRGAPAPTHVVLRWPRVRDMARALRLVEGATPADVLRSWTFGEETRAGALLPTGGAAAWTVRLPDHARLTLDVREVRSPVHGSTELSVTARVRVLDGTSVLAERVVVASAGGWGHVEVELESAGERPVQIELSAHGDAGGSVFFAEPRVRVGSDRPRRVLALFVDTVRADHLGMYGYTARPTSPRLDRWAAHAVRFDDHRTVAPWTLPSARAVLSGDQPERWATRDTLAGLLADAGFVTHAVVGNAYLSPVFDVHRGFGSFRYRMLLPTAAVVDDVRDVFAAHPDEDVFVLAQFMQAHLPYREPRAYRRLFAGAPPAGLGEPSRAALVRYDGDEPDFVAVRDHVIARYDQSLRVLDDAIAGLLSDLGDDVIVVVFSDHGEELWDHGGFEHGHTFHDELLRVPFLLRAPGLAPGVVDAPTSLLDVAPTLLDVLGLPTPPGLAGRSLLPVARGDEGAAEALRARDLAFGRPLYGPDGWGVRGVGGGWVVRDASASDLAGAPVSEARSGEWAGRLAGALGTEVPRVWRVRVRGPAGAGGSTLTVTHPAGVCGAWLAYDPRNSAPADVAVDDGRALVRVDAGRRPPGQVFVRPCSATLDVDGLSVRVQSGTLDVVWQAGARVPGWGVQVDETWSPAPFGAGVEAVGEGMAGELAALGYVE